MAVCRRMSVTEESDGGPAWKGLEKLIALRPSPTEIVSLKPAARLNACQLYS